MSRTNIGVFTCWNTHVMVCAVVKHFQWYPHYSPRALGWMVEKICNKLIFSGIVQQATMNDISKIPWNPNCGNYKIIRNISFLVPLLLGQISAYLMTWCALQGLSPQPQHSLFHTPHMVWLAACQALRDGADAVVWNSLSVNPNDSSWPHCHTTINIWLLVKISNSLKHQIHLMWSLPVRSFLTSQWIDRPTNQSIKKLMKEILTNREMQSCQQLLILPYHYTHFSLLNCRKLVKNVTLYDSRWVPVTALITPLTNPVIWWSICPINMMLTSISCFKTGQMQLI